MVKWRFARLLTMTLLDYYPTIRLLHMALALASGALFLTRGLGVVWGARWPMLRLTRFLSYGIDIALLSAALLLVHLLQLNPLTIPWLGVKLVTLVVYIVLGSLALKRAKTAWGRRLSFALALVCLAQMAAVALLHSPWGLLALGP